jgi:RNA 2',3'-cyclic 3'-phosphodiesterase
MPDMRLFFALWPDPGMQAALAEAVAAIVREAGDAGANADPDAAGRAARVADKVAGARLVPAKNFHFTLAFLGSVPLSRFEALNEIAARVARAFASRDLAIAVTLDIVEHWRKSHILCATASETPPAAVELAEALKRALIAENYAPDLKAFRPHVTLARRFSASIRKSAMAPLIWSFRELALVESTPGPQGSVYRVVASWPLSPTDVP